MQGALIVAQVAVSVMLLVGAGLLLASFYRLQRVETGYRSDGVLSAQIYGNFSRYPNIIEQRKLYLPVLERMQAQPGVSAAAITNAVPLGGGAPGTTRFDIEGRVVDDPERRPTADVRVASAAVLRHHRHSGGERPRLQRSRHRRIACASSSINKAMTKYWDGTDPIGSRIALPAPPAEGRRTPRHGVVHRGRRGRRRPAVRPGAGNGRAGLRAADANAVRHCRAGAGAGPPAIRRRSATCCAAPCYAVDPNQPVENVQTLDDLRSEALAAPRLTATLLGVFAALALLVTLAGIGGVIATSVQQRTKEFGLRMALGARRDSVLMMVVRQGLTLVVIGLAIGVVGRAGGRPRAVVVSLSDGAARSADLRRRRRAVHPVRHRSRA